MESEAKARTTPRVLDPWPFCWGCAEQGDSQIGKYEKVSDHILIASMAKPKAEELRVYLARAGNDRLWSLRRFWQDDNGNYWPTHRGISLRVEDLDWLESALRKTRELLEESPSKASTAQCDPTSKQEDLELCAP